MYTGNVRNIEVAVYKGDEMLAMGSIRECAKKLGVLPSTIYYYLMPAYQRKLDRRKHSSGNVRTVVRLDGGDDD